MDTIVKETVATPAAAKPATTMEVIFVNPALRRDPERCRIEQQEVGPTRQARYGHGRGCRRGRPSR
jgi:hypothetical protein